MRATVEQRARYAEQDRARAADYEAWRRQRVEQSQAHLLQHAYHEIHRLRAQARAQKSEYDREVDRLTERIVTLSKSIEDAEARLSHFSKRERVRRAAEAETAAKLASVERSTLVLADALVKTETTKSAPRGKRKIVHRDANNRITHVDEVPL